MLELSERNPEGALAYLQILRELAGGRVFEEFVGKRMDPEFIDRIFNEHQLFGRTSRPMASLAVSLALARLCHSRRLVESLAGTISRRIQSGNLTEGQMSLLPIAAISDLRWLAEETKVPEIRGFLEKLSL
jgi:hypothetical protein